MRPSFCTPSGKFPVQRPLQVFCRKGKDSTYREPVSGTDQRVVQTSDFDSEQCQGP